MATSPDAGPRRKIRCMLKELKAYVYVCVNSMLVRLSIFVCAKLCIFYDLNLCAWLLYLCDVCCCCCRHRINLHDSMTLSK